MLGPPTEQKTRYRPQAGRRRGESPVHDRNVPDVPRRRRGCEVLRGPADPCDAESQELRLRLSQSRHAQAFEDGRASKHLEGQNMSYPDDQALAVTVSPPHHSGQPRRSCRAHDDAIVSYIVHRMPLPS